MTPENLLGEWSRLLVDALAAAGVRELVVSPGSRSSSFTWAALNHERLRCKVIVDERSAAFFALGQAKVTGIPSALLCTSGSAAANYLPAVVEASLSATPLVVITADRPFELQSCGAAQTIDQTKLYGDFVRSFTDLGMPDARPEALRALQRSVAQAVHSAVFPVPGPAHLNARARKPLEPVRARSAAAEELERTVSNLMIRGPTLAQPPESRPSERALTGLAEACATAEHGLIVCGPASLAGATAAREALFQLARSSGFPLLCEASSQLRFAARSDGQRTDDAVSGRTNVCDAFDLLCSSVDFCKTMRPDLILQFGGAPTSSGFEQYLALHPSVARHVILAHGWSDPQSQATSLVLAEPAAVASLLCRKLEGFLLTPERSKWLSDWRLANAAAWRIIDSELGSTPTLTEGAAVRQVVGSLPRGALLAIGNSLPIREVDLFCKASQVGVEIWVQRGANGIDGLVSGAAGAASVAARPTTLLVGDVSFLHDVGGLAAARSLDVPFTIVVLNNDGGRIFEQLPIVRHAALPARALDAWLTPHGLELRHAAALFGHAHAAVAKSAELGDALERAQQSPGCSVIEARVSPHGASEQIDRIKLAVAEAFTKVKARDLSLDGAFA